MKQTTGDLWRTPAQVKVVPTNGMVTKIEKGLYRAHMGAGVAKQAATLWPQLAYHLGNRLHENGNRIYVFQVPPAYREAMWCTVLVTFPTKSDWHDPSIPALIWNSARDLMNACKQNGWEMVLLPRVGTGLGGLKWDDVKPGLDLYLNDHFTVITQE